MQETVPYRSGRQWRRTGPPFLFAGANKGMSVSKHAYRSKWTCSGQNSTVVDLLLLLEAYQVFIWAHALIHVLVTNRHTLDARVYNSWNICQTKYANMLIPRRFSCRCLCVNCQKCNKKKSDKSKVVKKRMLAVSIVSGRIYRMTMEPYQTVRSDD